MGAPMIEDERLYSFFDEFKANMDAAYICRRSNN